jgi:hypothetical protein
LADPGNKPLSSAKVKRDTRMTAARQCGMPCERDHIFAREGGERAFTYRIDRAGGCGVLDNPLLRVVMPGCEVGCMRESTIG